MNFRTRILATAALLLLLDGGGAGAVEGMFPLSDLDGLGLAQAGLALDPGRIYNPQGLSLVDAICRIGGCTGFFVSDQGLILTNHHCAFRAIRDASTAQKDCLELGFAAAARQDEIPAAGYTVRITETYRDVSAEVLGVLDPDMDPLARTHAIQKRTKEISLRTEAENPGKRAEVSEMFAGKTYVLFIYTYLKDVRLVYAPPQSVGDFGGEDDNWTWPRHSGDFSFLRAYVGPDGAPAAYAPQNVPYRPRQALRVRQEGVQTGDFVFLLGYPGTTYRHHSSHFLRHQAQAVMPLTIDWYEWQVAALTPLGQGDRARQLNLAARIKGLQNSLKNSRGKLEGIARLDLVTAKREQEDGLQEALAADPALHARFGHVLDSLADHYGRLEQDTPFESWLGFLRRSPQIMQAAVTVWEGAHERAKPEAEREAPYMERNLERTAEDLAIIVRTFDAQADRLILAELLRRAGGIPHARELAALAGCTGPEGAARAAALLDDVLGGTRLMDEAFLQAAMALTPDQLRALHDPLLDLAAGLYPAWEGMREQAKRRKGELDPLLAGLVEAKRIYLGREFVPDANGTLRLTHGRVEGYSPRDGVWYEPLTTVQGLLQKETGEEPFALPAGMRAMIAAGPDGGFACPRTGAVPVNLLYSTDTTGGSSGSPVLDSQGRVVGLNFDRPWEAVINDFAWDHDYSRSIGVDIRYVLWVVWKFGGGDRLLQEMQVAVPGG